MVFKKSRLMDFVLFVLVSFIAPYAFGHCLQSFNAYGPVYAPSTLSRTQKFMKEILVDHCEVVHLQEVWNAGQIQTIEKALDLSYISYTPNKEFRNGLMLLSRWDLIKAEYVRFQNNSDGGWFDGSRHLVGVEKGFAIQWLATPRGPVAFVNLHLHPSSKAVRIAQILELIQWRLKNSQVSLILTGDFNMTPKSIEHALVVNGLKVQDAVENFWGGYPSDFCTYCTSNRLSWLSENKVFDYVFFSGPIRITDVAVNMKGSVDYPFSDHYGLKIGWEFVGEDSVHRESEIDPRPLSKIFKVAMAKLYQESPKSSGIYRVLGLWRQQVVNQSGPFWDYLRVH